MYNFQVVHALREVSSPLPSVCDMLLCCSFCNETFRTTLLKQLMVSKCDIFSLWSKIF